MKLIDRKALATDVVAHDVDAETVHTDARAYSRLGWLIVLAGVVGFLLWATFAPLDKGVPMSGNIAKEGNRKSVQHLSGGTVQDILVKDGEQVKKGQVLVRMNGVQVNAQAEVTKSQLFTARATEARLIAERDGKGAPVFPPALKQYQQDPRVVENVALQNQLFATRQASLQSELGAFEENIAGLKSQLAGVEASRESKKEQQAILKEQVDNLRDLAKDGYVARARLLEVERNLVQVKGAIAEDVGTIGRLQRQIAETSMRRSQRMQDYQKEVRTQLADVQREATALTNRLTAEQYAVENTDVVSPVDGVVMGMTVFTKGGVVSPGFKMMDVVPLDDALVVEGRLPVNLVDKVHVGLPAELIFSAFNSNTTPHIPGSIIKVSADRLVDEHTGQPYYSVLAKVSPEGLKIMQHKKMEVRPGMPVELFVKTGERTMMNYLLKPIFDRAKSSMTEE
ncbi:HlyD family type I secretion periplasmic adaptor subunit [Pseudoduganella ginsengisoli]|uniref:Membrane fusion protein (MFP) family protein n=1 Tax=Pseudoduganella ginsengisoli TaxID=1462440 RepID=A0A6L6PUC4_9BURK|nr:HlyD family type I secretion periplasmic adaptor subunit [Pseudoduganella ginsengisoli]MTW00796.1 HlyD family type I secretion periplasmic adaptor subunit [Pseudoduganella ginsengisoli]